MAEESRHGQADLSRADLSQAGALPRVQEGRFQDSRTQDGVFAALDLGTNNCRMLVARAESHRPPHGSPSNAGPTGPEFRVIDSFSRITRLGEGVSATGRLSDQAMDRTIDALNQ